jgi:hypothetical protein
MSRLIALASYLLFLVLPGCVQPPHPPGPVALTNAGFEMPLDSGWVLSVVSDYDTVGFVERSDTLGQPEPGFAIRAYRLRRQFSRASQTAPLETLDQTVTFSARFRRGEDVPAAPMAAVSFGYLDSTGTRLGRTHVCLASSFSTLANSDSVHLIAVADTTLGWRSYSLNFKSELDSALAAIPQSRIASLQVEALAWVENSG